MNRRRHRDGGRHVRRMSARRVSRARPRDARYGSSRRLWQSRSSSPLIAIVCRGRVRRLLRTTCECADRRDADRYFAIAEQSSAEAAPVQLVLVRGGRRRIASETPAQSRIAVTSAEAVGLVSSWPRGGHAVGARGPLIVREWIGCVGSDHDGGDDAELPRGRSILRSSGVSASWVHVPRRRWR
jgi:hypothetical protein